MTVEQRESETAHGVPFPGFDMLEQLEYAIKMNNDAKQDGWTDTVLDIIADHCPFNVGTMEIAAAVYEVLGFEHWRDLSAWVVDDMCADFFNKGAA